MNALQQAAWLEGRDLLEAPARARARDPLAACLTVPNPLKSEQQAQQYSNTDLPDLSDTALWQAGRRAELALVLLDDPDPWFAARTRAVKQEQARRKRGSSH